MKQNPYGHVIGSFSPWSGTVKAGHTANFVGAVARIDRLYPGDYIKTLQARATTDYHLVPPPPNPGTTDYYETGAVLQAVVHAGAEFAMLELGSGTGPWTALAARAAHARHITKRRFVAVEGEPTRHAWLRENLLNNGITAEEFDTVCAVVAPSHKRDLKIYFPVGAPLFAGHGATLATVELQESRRQRQVNYVGRSEDARLEPALVVTLPDLLDRHDCIFDIAHIDIQGLEDQVISDAADAICARLRSVAIGTHSGVIETNLRKTLTGLGWTCVFEFPTQANFECSDSTISTLGFDGFQHWINPKLWRDDRSAHPQAVWNKPVPGLTP